MRKKQIPSSETKKRVSLEGKKCSLTEGNFFSLKFPPVRQKRRKVEEIPPSETTQRKYKIFHHRSLPLSTYNQPKMATVACSVLQLYIFLLPILPIRPSYHFALPYIHSPLAYNLPSFFSSSLPSLLFIPSFLLDRRPMLSHGEISLFALRGHRRKKRNFSSYPFFFIYYLGNRNCSTSKFNSFID